MPSITFTATASSTETSSTLNLLSLCVFSPTLQTRKHPLPLQGPRQWHCHRRRWYVSLPSISHPYVPWSFPRAKLLHSPDEQLASLAGSFGYVAPKVIKNTCHVKPVDILSTGTLASIRPRKRIRLIISLHSHHHLRPTLRLPPFPCWQHHRPRPTNRRSQNWISKSVLEPGFWTSQIFHPTSRHCRPAPSSYRSGGFTRSLAYPYSHHRRYAIPYRSFSHT